MSKDLLGLLSLVPPLREYTKEIDIVWWISSFFTHGKICKSYTGMNNGEMQDKICFLTMLNLMYGNIH